MSRVKRGVVSRRKHNKLLVATKGYRGAKHRQVKVARQAALHAGAYAFHGRKLKKRDFRALWITRISHASAEQGISYSKLIDGLRKSNIELDRKILADIISNDPETFKAVIDRVKTV